MILSGGFSGPLGLDLLAACPRAKPWLAISTVFSRDHSKVVIHPSYYYSVPGLSCQAVFPIITLGPVVTASHSNAWYAGLAHPLPVLCGLRLFGQVVLSDGREDLDRDGILHDRRAVLYLRGDGPAVAGSGVVCLAANREADMPFDQIARLLVRMRVHGQCAALLKNELGHQGPFAVAEGLHSNPRQRGRVCLEIVLSEHRFASQKHRVAPKVTGRPRFKADPLCFPLIPQRDSLQPQNGIPGDLRRAVLIARRCCLSFVPDCGISTAVTGRNGRTVGPMYRSGETR